MSRPALSVLLPCRNAEATIDECLRSLSSQSFEDFEVVAVDDGSADATLRILNEWSRVDSRFRVNPRPFRGILSTLVESTHLASGPLLARMDADDVCEPTRFDEQVRFLTDTPEVAVVGCRVRMFPRRDLRQGGLRYESWLNGLLTHCEMQRDLFVESPLAHPSVVMRRNVFEELGGYRERGWAEDYDLWLRLFLEGHQAHKLPSVLVHWRESPHRASRIETRYSADSFFAAKLHYLSSRVLSPSRPIVVWGAGRVGKRWIVALRERGFGVERVVELDPRKIGKTIHGARVIHADELGAAGETMVLVAVGALSRIRGQGARSPWFSAREEIRELLTARGYREWRDFLCVA